MTRRQRSFLLALAFAPLSTALGQQQSGAAYAAIDWDALRTEAVGLLSEYIRINTTNPPGNELAGARFLQTQTSALVTALAASLNRVIGIDTS